MTPSPNWQVRHLGMPEGQALENADRVLEGFCLRNFREADLDALGQLRLVVEQVEGATGFDGRTVSANSSLYSCQSFARDKLELKVQRARDFDEAGKLEIDDSLLYL